MMNRLTFGLLPAVLLAAAMSTLAQAQVTEQDSLALVALYDATDGPNWNTNTNWLTGPVETWHGVSVSGDRVTEVTLLENQLSGAIPPELGHLDKLQTLNLSNQQLSGTIPPELGALKNLRTLFLKNTLLTGPIPPALGTLSQLETLAITSAQLSGEIPPELGNLGRLKKLYLSGKQLTGSIPPELGNLTNLTILLFWGTLTGPLPPELANLSKLQHLLLGDNQLTGPVPPEFGRLTNLTSLAFHSNRLSGDLPVSLTNLTNLRIFWFQNTALCEPADLAFQTWLQSLERVRSTGETCTATAIENIAAFPTVFALEANYPNPFNPTTHIRYALPQPAAVRLSIYNVSGRLVEVIVSAEQAAGWHEVTFEAGGLPSGIYFYQFEAGAFRETKPMLLAK